MNRNQKNIAIVLGLLYAIEIVASVNCKVSFILAPLSALFLVAPVAIVGFAYSRKPSFTPAVVGMLTVVPFLLMANRLDCVGPSGGDAAMGAVFPWLYGIPLGLLAGWLTSRAVRKKLDEVQ